MNKLLISLLIVFIFINTVWALPAAPISMDCEFYLQLEKEMGCGEQGYPLSFGHKYCNAFLNTKFDIFSKKGKVFLEKNALCLQKIIYNQIQIKPEMSCEELRKFAFSTHSDCYLESGFCEVGLGTKVHIWNIIKDVRDTDEVQVEIKQARQMCKDLKD